MLDIAINMSHIHRDEKKYGPWMLFFLYLQNYFFSSPRPTESGEVHRFGKST